MKRIAVPGLAVITLTLLLGAAPVQARDKDDKSAPPPPIYQAVVDCRTVADAGERLACFDRTVGAMASAREGKELVVMDRAAVREARRGLFGFTLPKLRLFGGNDEDEKDEVKQIDSTIAGLRSASDGFPIFVLEDGARWKQTDGRNAFPKVGDKIRIKRGALGSYIATIDKVAGIRVLRLGN